MTYSMFLNLIHQLTERSKGYIQLEESVFCMERLPKKNRWRFSLPLFRAQGEELSCFSKSGAFLFVGQGSVSLQLDPRTSWVSAVQEVELPWKQYVPFRSLYSAFICKAESFRDLCTPS